MASLVEIKMWREKTWNNGREKTGARVIKTRSNQQRGLMSRMRLRKVESTEILFETRENERWRPLSRRP